MALNVNMLVSNDTLAQMDDSTLRARAKYFEDQARDIITSTVDSKNIPLLAEIRTTAKAYVKESMRSRLMIDVRKGVFNAGGRDA